MERTNNQPYATQHARGAIDGRKDDDSEGQEEKVEHPEVELLIHGAAQAGVEVCTAAYAKVPAGLPHGTPQRNRAHERRGHLALVSYLLEARLHRI